MTAYDYASLRQSAMDHRCDDLAEQTAEALANWMSAFDDGSWNGECYDVDNGWYLYPVYADEPDEDDCYPVLYWELR